MSDPFETVGGNRLGTGFLPTVRGCASAWSARRGATNPCERKAASVPDEGNRGSYAQSANRVEQTKRFKAQRSKTPSSTRKEETNLIPKTSCSYCMGKTQKLECPTCKAKRICPVHSKHATTCRATHIADARRHIRLLKARNETPTRIKQERDRLIRLWNLTRKEVPLPKGINDQHT